MQTSSTVRDGVTDKAAAGIDRLSASAHQAVERAASAASSTAQQLSAKSEEWLAARDEWMETTRGYVRQHPLAALGAALAVGFLLSRLIR